VKRDLTALAMTLSLSLVFGHVMASTTEKELLATALRASQALSPEMAIKKKLTTYETIIESYETIITGYGSSDIGLALLSSGKYQNFDFEAHRAAYLKELTSYYETVCSLSPSVECLAFVSMHDAYTTCSAHGATQVNNSAGDNLFNAMRVFGANKQYAKYTKVSAGIYRDCFISNERLSSYQQDFHRSKLAQFMLKSGNTDGARGLIQAMETPVFKFQGAVQITIASKGTLGDDQFSRLQQYINDKLPSRALPYIDLISARLDTGATFSKGEVNALGPVFRPMHIQDCEFELRHVFRQLAGFSTRIVALGASAQLLLSSIPAVIQSTCGEAGQAYAMALELHNAAIFRNDADQAQNILSSIQRQTPTRLALFQQHVQANMSNEKLLRNVLLVPTRSRSDLRGIKRSMSEYIVEHQLGGQARLEEYKLLLKLEYTCDAIKLLFGAMRGTDVYPIAVNEFLESNLFGGGKTVSCGDEDLELLLN